MKVLHLSATPLVGAPGRICRALRIHPDVEARWAVLNPEAGVYERMAFELDLTWGRDRKEIIELAERCDVLHLHNQIGLHSTEFAPLDFELLRASGKPILRHLHSNPELIDRITRKAGVGVADCPLPKLVIAQYQERFFPRARLVPNIVFPDASYGLPATESPVRIGYAPSRFNTGHASRWDTKGYPETIKILKRLSRTMRARGAPVEVDVIENVPHKECMRRKAHCHVVIDDLATGSYHLNTLESLAQGSACLTFLDRRVQQILVDLTGRSDFPAISAGLEDAFDVLVDLCMKPDLVADIGKRSAQWMAEHWAPAAMAVHFLDAYGEVRRSPNTTFPARFPDDETSRWLTRGIHDVQWRCRRKHWPRVIPPWLLQIRGAGGTLLRRVGLRR